MKNTKLTSILLALFAYGIAGCGGPATSNRPDVPRNGSSNTAAEPGPGANTPASNNTNAVGVVPPGPGIAITAQEFGKEYQRDPAAFDQKYKGKTLDITGSAILAGRSGDHFVIMLAGVEDESTAKSVNIECGVPNNEQANELGKAVGATLEQAKKTGSDAKGGKYPVAAIKGIYEYSPPAAHGETMPIISLKPCELTAVPNVK